MGKDCRTSFIHSIESKGGRCPVFTGGCVPGGCLVPCMSGSRNKREEEGKSTLCQHDEAKEEQNVFLLSDLPLTNRREKVLDGL